MLKQPLAVVASRETVTLRAHMTNQLPQTVLATLGILLHLLDSRERETLPIISSLCRVFAIGAASLFITGMSPALDSKTFCSLSDMARRNEKTVWRNVTEAQFDTHVMG